jgi:NAD(P)-dependent dehydrogenase (short-subunit alcohol dehydrogenase family)
MAGAAARILAERGDALFLAGHEPLELQRLASDLRIRCGAKVAVGRFDALDPAGHPGLFAQVLEQLGGLDQVLVASGYLGPDPRALGGEEPARILAINFTGLLPMVGLCADHFQRQGRGVILGIGSVAGDRGRQSNFVYGAAKGGFALWLQGLRNRLHASGVRVVTFKPGFVDTTMTFGKPGLFLVAAPEAAGAALARALDGGPDIVYFPAFWRIIMALIRAIPERVFKGMKL